MLGIKMGDKEPSPKHSAVSAGPDVWPVTQLSRKDIDIVWLNREDLAF